MNFIYRLFNLDSTLRENVVIVTSGIGIIINLCIALLKIGIGMAVSSMAIISEGINNSVDAASSCLTVIGTKLAGMRPTKEYPFGFGRIEYLTSLIIGTMILVAGGQLFVDSVKLIFEPEEIEISYTTMGIILITAAIKLFLALFQISEGKRISSSSLVAVGKEGREDSLGSIITLTSGFIYLILGYNIDAYASLITSCLILKVGYEVLHETIGNILGQAGNKELAENIYRVIRKEPIVLNAADMMLHNYGPDAYSGSVNIEIDHKKSLGEIYKTIHKLQLQIMHEYNITMVFGMYAVDQDNSELKEMRKYIASFIRDYKNVVSYHALYIDRETHTIYVDLMVDYELADWDKLRMDFTKYMNKLYPEQNLELVIETQFV